jgi:hypothetical protein
MWIAVGHVLHAVAALSPVLMAFKIRMRLVWIVVASSAYHVRILILMPVTGMRVKLIFVVMAIHAQIITNVLPEEDVAPVCLSLAMMGMPARLIPVIQMPGDVYRPLLFALMMVTFAMEVSIATLHLDVHMVAEHVMMLILVQQIPVIR